MTSPEGGTIATQANQLLRHTGDVTNDTQQSHERQVVLQWSELTLAHTQTRRT